MKIKIDIDIDDLLRYTSFEEDKEIAKKFISEARDEDVVNEVIDRCLVENVLDELNESTIEEIFGKYGFVREE